jgi:hypothetical protein
MKSKALIIGLFVVAAIAIFFFTRKGDDPKNNGVGSATPSASSAGTAAPLAQVAISMSYSSEKQDWVESCATAFRKDHPEIQLTLNAKGSIDLEQAILDGKDKPTVFSPADSLIQNLLASDWETKNKTPIIATSGQDQPQPLLITPLVFVVWEDRGDVLAKAAKGVISWKTIHKAVTANEGWPAIKGDSKWGFVKLGHTDPTRSNSGLQALLLMTLEYYDKQKGLEVGDLLQPKFQEYVKGIEKGVPKFEVSTKAFMDDMIRFGPSKYDIALVYENLAISSIENAQGRWGTLKIAYPSTTIWSDHPVALLQADWVTPAQKDAARLWIAHLRSRAMQEQALAYGFRPADTSVPLKSADQKNPFNRLADKGVKVDVPPAAEPPSGQVVRNLMMMWQRVVPQR